MRLLIALLIPLGACVLQSGTQVARELGHSRELVHWIEGWWWNLRLCHKLH